MSSQFRYLLTYEQMVTILLRAHPQDEAMARAVGGDYERFGVLEHALLRAAGLRPDSCVVDVGCGSGRLACQLARYGSLRYLGTDVVPALLQYARRRAGRDDFRFEHVDRIALPAPDGEADLVAFFSVFTHLLPEESFVYLTEAHRALKPGGKVVFSFLEYGTPESWQVFEGNLNWVRTRAIAGHLNVFLNRADLRLWAERLGFAVAGFQAGAKRNVTVDEAAATPEVPPGDYAFGQSICVLEKPEGASEAPPAGGAGRERRRAARAERRRRARGAGSELGGPQDRPPGGAAASEREGAAPMAAKRRNERKRR
jgi:SAM-dependent methyltransferase